MKNTKTCNDEINILCKKSKFYVIVIFLISILISKNKVLSIWIKSSCGISRVFHLKKKNYNSFVLTFFLSLKSRGNGTQRDEIFWDSAEFLHDHAKVIFAIKIRILRKEKFQSNKFIIKCNLNLT